MDRWDALNARTRGLSARLLEPGQLRTLARSPDLAGLARHLEELGYVATGTADVSAGDLERRVRRAVGARLRILMRWSVRRARGLRVVFEDEDRRSLRALLRGAAAAVARESRLAGLIPTPALPERALGELARQPTVSAVAGLLVAWESPYGSPLLPETQRPEPDLFRLELAVNRTFFARALDAAPRSGTALRDYVERLIDLENTWSALVLASQGGDSVPEESFIAGGRAPDVGLFQEAVSTRDAAGARDVLLRGLRTSWLAAVLRATGGEPTRLEDAALREMTRSQVRAARLDPLGPAPTLAYVLRLRGEARDLARIIWGVTLRAPERVIGAELVSL